MRSRIWLTLCLTAVLFGCSAPNAPTETSSTNTKSAPISSAPADSAGGKDDEHKQSTAVGENDAKPPDDSELPKSQMPTTADPATSGKSVGELIEQLGKSNAREAASAALVAKGPAAVSSLTDALSNENWRVRAGAVFTLSQLGKDAEAALPALKKIAETDAEEAVRDAALFAMDAIEGRQP